MNPFADTPDPMDVRTGIRVGHAEITIPDGFDRLGWMTDPDEQHPARGVEPVMVAFVWVRIEDGLGTSYTFSDLRLVRDSAGWRLSMPSETKRPKCQHKHGARVCGGRNHPRANYCNWCGGPLKPEPEAKYHEFVRCGNDASYRLLLDAVIAAYRIAYEERKAETKRALRVPASIR